MKFHRKIKSNDSLGCFASIFVTILFIFGLFFLYAAFHNDDMAGKIFMILWISVIGVCFLSAIYHIIYPQEWELVVSKDSFRWGNVRKPKKQKNLQMKDISYICFDCGVDADCTYAIMKDNKHKRLPDNIIRRKSYDKELKEYLINNAPEIIIRHGYPNGIA